MQLPWGYQTCVLWAWQTTRTSCNRCIRISKEICCCSDIYVQKRLCWWAFWCITAVLHLPDLISLVELKPLLMFHLCMSFVRGVPCKNSAFGRFIFMYGCTLSLISNPCMHQLMQTRKCQEVLHVYNCCCWDRMESMCFCMPLFVHVMFSAVWRTTFPPVLSWWIYSLDYINLA